MALAALSSAYDTSSDSETEEDISDQPHGPPSALVERRSSQKQNAIPPVPELGIPAGNNQPYIVPDMKMSNGETSIPLLDFSSIKQEVEDEVVFHSGEAYVTPQIKQEPLSEEEEETEDSEEDSDMSSGASSEAEDDSNENSTKAGKKKKKKKNKATCMEPPKVKGELSLKDLPPIEDLFISVPHEQAKPIGVVKSFVDPLVVVEAFPNIPALDLDSVLFLDEGDRALGHVFDVLGPVKQPLYCVRFNSLDHIEKNGITKGMLVYCAPSTPHARFVLLAQLEKYKGTDASWKNDHEPPPEELVSSEDEFDKIEKQKSKRRVARARKTVNPSGNDGQQIPYQGQPSFMPPQVPGFYQPFPNRPNYRGHFPRQQRHRNPQNPNFRPFAPDISNDQIHHSMNGPNSMPPAFRNSYPQQQYPFGGRPHHQPAPFQPYNNPYASPFPRYNHPYVQNSSWQNQTPPPPPPPPQKPKEPLPPGL